MKSYAVIGLGYVGLTIATALGEKRKVFGYDINEKRIDKLNQNIEKTRPSKSHDLKNNVFYTSKISDIKSANFFIVSVPTPVFSNNIPNLNCLIDATKSLGKVLKKNDIIVYESTVYPGATEEICIPILESVSNLKYQEDFHVGYSPERINPGDKKNNLYNIPKVISADNKKTLRNIKSTYELICKTVIPVSSIKTAESIKLLENIQRDINIALMNEFTKVMHALDLNIYEVIEGAKTKWSFAPFKPGLVGGHCIAVDPYYLSYKAKLNGIKTDLLLTARKVNNQMLDYIINNLFEMAKLKKLNLKKKKIGVFGISYKENVNDIRNSLSIKLIKKLKSKYQINCTIHDPLNYDSIKLDSAIDLKELQDIADLDVLIFTVAHDFYKETGIKKFLKQFKKVKIILDIPGMYINERKYLSGVTYWSL